MRTSATYLDRQIFARVLPDLSRIATEAVRRVASVLQRRRIAMSPMSGSWLRGRETHDWRQDDRR